MNLLNKPFECGLGGLIVPISVLGLGLAQDPGQAVANNGAAAANAASNVAVATVETGQAGP